MFREKKAFFAHKPAKKLSVASAFAILTFGSFSQEGKTYFGRIKKDLSKRGQFRLKDFFSFSRKSRTIYFFLFLTFFPKITTKSFFV